MKANYKKDNRASWITGVLLITIMIVGLALFPVRMTGVLPNGRPVSVTAFTEEGGYIKLQKELKKTEYSYYKKYIIR